MNVGASAILRVTLRDGVFHEDVGYGAIENVKGKGMALDKVTIPHNQYRSFLLIHTSARKRP